MTFKRWLLCLPPRVLLMGVPISSNTQLTHNVKATICIYRGDLRVDIRRFVSNIPERIGIAIPGRDWKHFYNRIYDVERKFRQLYGNTTVDGCVHTFEINPRIRLQLCVEKDDVFTLIYHYIGSVRSIKGITLDSLETLAFFKRSSDIEEAVNLKYPPP